MKNILIIDDDPDAIAVFEFFLKKNGYNTYFILNPSNVIETMANLLVDLIILDWQMPEKDGIEVLNQIRTYSKFENIPIIICTGAYILSTDMKVALGAGAMDYIRKPINETEFNARITNTFRLVDLHKNKLELKNQQLESTEIKAKLLEDELSKKEREMMAIAVNIIQNKKLLTCIKSDIFETKINFEIMQHRFLNQIFKKYENIANSLNWGLFEKRFIETNSSFYNNLATEFPTLSWTELRLCALFKIGFTLKEISALNYSNYDAVRKALYRIRKKLNIDEKTDINLFLQRF